MEVKPCRGKKKRCLVLLLVQGEEICSHMFDLGCSMTSEDIYVPFFLRLGKKERRCIIDQGISCISIWTSPPSRSPDTEKNATQDEGSLFHRRCYVSPAREW